MLQSVRYFKASALRRKALDRHLVVCLDNAADAVLHAKEVQWLTILLISAGLARSTLLVEELKRQVVVELVSQVVHLVVKREGNTCFTH